LYHNANFVGLREYLAIEDPFEAVMLNGNRTWKVVGSLRKNSGVA